MTAGLNRRHALNLAGNHHRHHDGGKDESDDGCSHPNGEETTAEQQMGLPAFLVRCSNTNTGWMPLQPAPQCRIATPTRSGRARSATIEPGSRTRHATSAGPPVRVSRPRRQRHHDLPRLIGAKAFQPSPAPVRVAPCRRPGDPIPNAGRAYPRSVRGPRCVRPAIAEEAQAA